MERFGCEAAIAALMALDAADVPAKVDGLVDDHLVGCSPQQASGRRAELARAFLNAAPFTELSYRIWRRIAGENDTSGLDAEFVSQSPSLRFLPTVEFPASR